MPPAPVYKGARGERRPARRRCARRSPTPSGSRTPCLPCWTRRKGEGGGREEGKGGAAPLSLSYSDWGGGACGPALASSPLFHIGPLRPIKLPGGSGNLPVLRKNPESLGIFPKSEYSRPIYRSLRLDHFETPRHVPDLIRDSELLRYIKTHKLII